MGDGRWDRRHSWQWTTGFAILFRSQVSAFRPVERHQVFEELKITGLVNLEGIKPAHPVHGDLASQARIALAQHPRLEDVKRPIFFPNLLLQFLTKRTMGWIVVDRGDRAPADAPGESLNTAGREQRVRLLTEECLNCRLDFTRSARRGSGLKENDERGFISFLLLQVIKRMQQ